MPIEMVGTKLNCALPSIIIPCNAINMRDPDMQAKRSSTGRIELLGVDSAEADAEVIAMAIQMFLNLG